MVDLSKLSDDELLRIAQGESSGPDLSGYSDDELIQLAQGNPQESANTGKARTALDQSLQGATFNTSDEIRAGIGSLGAKAFDKASSLLTGEEELFKDRGVSDLYDESLKSERVDLKAQLKERPVLSIASNIAGGLLTGGAAASTKAGKALASSVGSGGLFARAVKGGVTATPVAAAYGFGSGEGGAENRLESAIDSGMVGGALGFATPIAVAGASKLASKVGKGTEAALEGFSARPPEQLDEAASLMRKNAGELYKQSRQIGATFNKQATNKLVKRIDGAFSDLGKSNARLHGDTLSVADELKTIAKKKGIGLEELEQYRQLFGEVVSKSTDAIKGMNPDALKASRAIDAIDDVVEKLSAKDLTKGNIKAVEVLNAGRAEWRKLRKFEAVSNIVKQSDGDPNKLKSALQRFVNKPKNLRGFSREEVSALKDAAKNTGSEKLLKAFGKFGFDLGASLTPGNTALPAASMAFLGIPSSAPLTIGGTAARQLQKYLGRGKAEQVLKIIERGAREEEIIKQLTSQAARLPKGSLTPATLEGQAAAIMERK